MNYRVMQKEDIPKAAELYIAYYNQYEDGEWNEQTTAKRISQVLTREDSLCLMLEDEDKLIAFAMGYFEQYDDSEVYDLVEIVVAKECQNQGIGTQFMREIERQAKEKGALLIQLEAVNDDKHNLFYGKLGFKDAGNLVLKCKML